MASHMRALRPLIMIFLAMAVGGVGLSFGGPAAAQDEQNRDRASVTFIELNDSGLSGTAELTALRQGTEVSMRVNGVVSENPTHIHTGTCDDLDPNPKYPLNNVELNTTELVGTSDTVVDVPLEDLLANDHLILIHKSAEELNTYYACGNIVAETGVTNVADDTGATDVAEEDSATGGGRTDEAGTSGAGHASDHGLGNMGSGPVSGARDAVGLAAGLGLVAVTLGLTAVTLRRRELRG
jgi:hypothetical protein